MTTFPRYGKVKNVRTHQPRSTLLATQSTLYTLHSTFYTVHSTLHTRHFTLHTSHCAFYIPRSTLHTLHFTSASSGRCSQMSKESLRQQALRPTTRDPHWDHCSLAIFKISHGFSIAEVQRSLQPSFPRRPVSGGGGGVRRQPEHLQLAQPTKAAVNGKRIFPKGRFFYPTGVFPECVAKGYHFTLGV